jgi:pyrimidine-nucleoside phosphorylase
MRTVDIIEKKRDGQALSHEEIRWFIQNYTNGTIPDYQAAALLMAIFLRGMNRDEIVTLTLEMAHSGTMLDLSDIAPYIVDKHSSGGVGDKTTLVVLPLVAAMGVPVAKMSGRGLGLSGGTLDKLEAIAGFQCRLTEQQFRAQAKEIGLVLAGQTGELAPADGKLYALRDVTGTIDSMPLIAASIMSKKLAAGAQGIVLDVKAGRGAFMRDVDRATELARMMVEIGTGAGRDMIALISDMNQPLGCAVGNALEVREALETMQGAGPDDFREHCLTIASRMLRLAGQGKRWTDDAQTRSELEAALQQGHAFARFRAMVQAQHGDVSMIDDPGKLPAAQLVAPVTASRSGYIQQIAADDIGRAALILGAGRDKKEDSIDMAVGFEVLVKVGSYIEAGSPIVNIHANDEARLAAAREVVERSIVLSDQPTDALPLFYAEISG